MNHTKGKLNYVSILSIQYGITKLSYKEAIQICTTICVYIRTIYIPHNRIYYIFIYHLIYIIAHNRIILLHIICITYLFILY